MRKAYPAPVLLDIQMKVKDFKYNENQSAEVTFSYHVKILECSVANFMSLSMGIYCSKENFSELYSDKGQHCVHEQDIYFHCGPCEDP